MNEQELAAQLQREGYTHSYVWEDSAGKRYPDDTHALATANIILSGEITITVRGESHLYRSGDRCDIPAKTIHSAVMGPKGCRYLVGEREAAH